MAAEYTIYRYHCKNKTRVIRSGVTLEEAQKMCSDPETSSRTAKQPKGCGGKPKVIANWDEKQKHWFYGYAEEQK